MHERLSMLFQVELFWAEKEEHKTKKGASGIPNSSQCLKAMLRKFFSYNSSHLLWTQGGLRGTSLNYRKYFPNRSVKILYIYFISLFCIYEYFCLLVFLCTLCVSGSLRGQKKVMDLLEHELHTAVSHHVGAGNGTYVL